MVRAGSARYPAGMGQLRYVIDDVTLRDSAVPEDLARARVGELEALGPEGDHERVPLLRMLGLLDEAEAVGWKALDRAGGPGGVSNLPDVVLEPMAIAPAIRLAHVLHWRTDYEIAETLFVKAFDAIERLSAVEPGRASRLEAFAHQHIGKMRFDQGRLDEALEHFTNALQLRQELGAPDDQIASTQQAIAAVRRLLPD